MAEAARRDGRIPRRRFRGLEGGKIAPGSDIEAASARRAGAHSVGDASSAEDRPDRLPLADQALHRSARRVSVRGTSRSRWRLASASMPLPSTSRTCSGATAANSARSTSWSRSSAWRRRRCCDWRPWCARADTARLDLSPEAPGLLAASLGLSRMYDDDLEQLEAGIALYDAFYRWCRDATGETHNWPTSKAKP